MGSDENKAIVRRFVEEIPNLGAAIDPTRHGSRSPELDVIGVGGDNEHPLGSGQPVDRHRSGDPGR